MHDSDYLVSQNIDNLVDRTGLVVRKKKRSDLYRFTTVDSCSCVGAVNASMTDSQQCQTHEIMRR